MLIFVGGRGAVLHDFDHIEEGLDERPVHILPDVDELVGEIVWFNERAERYDVAVRDAAHAFAFHIPNDVGPPKGAHVEDDRVFHESYSFWS